MTTLAELMVKVGVDDDELDSGLGSAVKTADRSFGRIADSADDAGMSIDRAGDRAEGAFSGVTAGARRAGSALDGVGTDADQLGSKLEAAGSEGGNKLTEGVRSGVSGVGSAVEGVGSAASGAITSGFDPGAVAASLSGMLESVGDTLGPVGAAVGAGVGGAIVVGLLEGADREKASDQLAARLTLDPEEQRRAGEVAGSLYTGAYVGSVGEANVVIDALLSSIEGLRDGTERELEAAGVHATDFANIWEVDVVEAVGTAGVLIEQDLARNTEDAFDQMQVAMSRTPAQFRDELIPAIQEYAGHVRGLGIEGPEMLQLMADSAEDFGTIGIDKAGDALKEFGLRATDTATSTEEAFDEIGLDMGEMQTKLLAGGADAREAFDEIVSSLLQVEDPVARAQAAVDLFGTPLEDLSKEQIPDFLLNLASMDAGLGDTADAMDEAGEVANDNLATRLESLKNTAMTEVVDFVDTKVIPAFNAIKQWAQDNPALFQAVTIAAIALAGALGVLAIALIGVGIAALPITAPMLLIAGIVAALIAVVALLVIHWDTVKNAGGDAWDFIFEKGRAAFNWIKDNWPTVLAILTGPFGLAVLLIAKNWQSIMDGASAVKNWITDRLDEVVSFVTGLPGRIAGAASGMWDGIKDAFRFAINTVIGWWNGISFTLPTIEIPGFDPPGPGPSFGGATIGGQTFSTPDLPSLATGGIVKAIPGGSLIRAGEGRHDEAVVPLPRGLANLAAEGGRDPAISVTVQGSVLSERDLIEIVRDEFDRGGFGGSAAA